MSAVSASAAEPLPFDAFVRTIAAARAADWVGRTPVGFSDAASFRASRAYLAKHYRGQRAAGSTVIDGQVFDCIVRDRRRAGASGGTMAECPAGTVPTRRVTLEEMARLGGPKGLLGKSPDGGDPGHFRP